MVRKKKFRAARRKAPTVKRRALSYARPSPPCRLQPLACKFRQIMRKSLDFSKVLLFFFENLLKLLSFLQKLFKMLKCFENRRKNKNKMVLKRF